MMLLAMTRFSDIFFTGVGSNIKSFVYNLVEKCKRGGIKSGAAKTRFYRITLEQYKGYAFQIETQYNLSHLEDLTFSRIRRRPCTEG